MKVIIRPKGKPVALYRVGFVAFVVVSFVAWSINLMSSIIVDLVVCGGTVVTFDLSISISSSGSSQGKISSAGGVFFLVRHWDPSPLSQGCH